MDRARQAIEWTSGLIDRGRAHFAHRDVDDVQMEVYDLALSTAELQAARAMLDHADLPAPSGEASFKRSLGNLYCADALATVLARLQSRPTAFGLEPEHFHGGHSRSSANTSKLRTSRQSGRPSGGVRADRPTTTSARRSR